MSPVLSPTGWSGRDPTTKVHRRLAIVPHRNTQNIQWHVIWVYSTPGTVVPGTGIPGIIFVDPIHPIIKEIVGVHPWSIIDRIIRHPDKFRVDRQVNPDAHVG
jgi:hypothetical protein